MTFGARGCVPSSGSAPLEPICQDVAVVRDPGQEPDTRSLARQGTVSHVNHLSRGSELRGECPISRICVDATFLTVDALGNLTFRRESVGLQSLQVYTTPGVTSFTKASFPGLTRIRVRAVGGGGGGAGADAAPGESVARAGGGGGGYSESIIDAAALGASETISIGLGGAGGVGNDFGDNGGDTSFGGFVLARGGAGSSTAGTSGTTVQTVPGTPGAGIGIGQITTAGGSGGPAGRLNGTDIIGGEGGDSGGGYGQGGNARAAETVGASGRGYGGAGAGGLSRGAAVNGGPGSSGAVFIELFY